MHATQNLEHIFHDMVMENAQLQHKIECNTQQLMRKEAELTMAEETIMREQQTIQEMRRQVYTMHIYIHTCQPSWIFRDYPGLVTSVRIAVA